MSVVTIELVEARIADFRMIRMALRDSIISHLHNVSHGHDPENLRMDLLEIDECDINYLIGWFRTDLSKRSCK